MLQKRFLLIFALFLSPCVIKPWFTVVSSITRIIIHQTLIFWWFSLRLLIRRLLIWFFDWFCWFFRPYLCLSFFKLFLSLGSLFLLFFLSLYSLFLTSIVNFIILVSSHLERLLSIRHSWLSFKRLFMCSNFIIILKEGVLSC